MGEKKVGVQDGSAQELAQESSALIEEMAEWAPTEPLLRTLDCWRRAPHLLFGVAILQTLAANWIWPLLVILPTLPFVMEISARSLTGRPRIRREDFATRLWVGSVGIGYVTACLFLWTLLAFMVLPLGFMLLAKILGPTWMPLAFLLSVPPGLYFLKIYTAMLLGYPATSLFGGEAAYRNAYELVRRDGWKRLAFGLPFFLWFGVVVILAGWMPFRLAGTLVFFLGLDLFASVWTFRYLHELQRWRILDGSHSSFPGNRIFRELVAAPEESQLQLEAEP